MAAPGCGIIFAPSLRTDHRASLRKSFSLRPAAGRTSVDSEQTAAMGPFTQGHNRSLSDRAKALQARKKKEQEMMLAGRSIPTGLPTPAARRYPEMHAQRDRDHKANEERVRHHIGTGMENMSTTIKRMDEPPPPPPPRDQSYRQIAYKKYWDESPGLPRDEQRPKPAAVHRLRPQQTPLSRPDSDMSVVTTNSMEVNFHMAPDPFVPFAQKERRPKLQVTVPSHQAAPTPKHLIHQFNRAKTNGKKHPDDVSPPSSTTQQTRGGEVPARLSIVSPLSVVEMPKPRRPFSAFSLEDMTSDIPSNKPPKTAPLPRSFNSDSEDTGNDDDRSSNYSKRSSMSSLSDHQSTIAPTHSLERRHSLAFSIMNPNKHGVFDNNNNHNNMPAVPKIPKQHLKHAKSTALIRPNTNKPLPPEPVMEEVKPLRLQSTTYSRNSMHGKRKAPTPLTISRASTIDMSGLPSRLSSLRSKYTPTHLDTLDAAFVDRDSGYPYHGRQPSLEQAELDLEAHLNTIEEDDRSEIIPLAHDPLQISRGPNHMVPSRHAPAPPTALDIKLSDGRSSSRKRKPSLHVAQQMKTTEQQNGDEMRRRISAPYGGGSLAGKASRVLGRTNDPEDPHHHHTNTATPMSREGSSGSNWSSSESPENSYDDSSSPEMSNRENSSTPETDVSSIPDPAFDEVKARLELLSPKDAASKPAFSDWPQGHQHTLSSDRYTPPVRSTEPRSEMTVHRDAHSPESETQARRGRNFKEQARSLASIAMSEYFDLYADLPPALPSPIPRTREEMSAEEVERMISADAAEKVLLRILQNLDNLHDLFATATVSRGFYRTFKRHELPLMKNALRGMSPAAWELREMSNPYPGLQGEDSHSPRLDYTPSLYLQHYMRDMYTMIALKSMILIHCESFLRADTITALAGGETERASQIDDAFWRVWTFCQIFGCGNNREDDIVGQMDWLRGGVQARYQARHMSTKQRSELDRNSIMFSPPSSFGQGNAGGLSAEDLYDMTEIWTCLGVLVRGFQGKRQEARDFGIYANADITPGDVEAEDAVLEEWSYHLLTLAPPTVLDVTSPTTPTAATFAHARSHGYTSWNPPTISRATFLKEAVSRIYQEKVAETHPNSQPSSPKSNITALKAASPANLEEDSVTETVAARWRCARHAAEIRAKRNDPNFKATPPSEDRPMSEWTSVLSALDSEAPPVPAMPGAYPTHIHHRATPSETDTAKHMVSALVVPAGPQVRDPVDLAVDKLVAMGFDASKAKKALADTDTGNSVDFDGALQHLVRERKRDVNGMMHAGYRGKAEERGGMGHRARQQTDFAREQREHEMLMQAGMDGLVSPLQGGVAGLGLSGMGRY